MDKFLHDNRFSNPSSSKKSYLSSLQHRSYKVDNFDTCFENFCFICKVFKFWCRSMDRVHKLSFWCWEIINGISKDIEHTSKDICSRRDSDRRLCSDDFKSSSESIYRVHRDSSYNIVSKLLLYF